MDIVRGSKLARAPQEKHIMQNFKQNKEKLKKKKHREEDE